VKVSWLRIFRISRIFRHPRVKQVKELHMLVCGFVGSVRALAFGALMIIGVLVFSSILLVQYIHPSNLEIDHGVCDRCSRAFETVLATSLTLFQQIIAGDNWGELSIPNIEADWKAAVLLPLVQIMIGLGTMNLILAVIVDCAVEAREAKKEDAMKQKIKDTKERKSKLMEMFQQLDVDGNGGLDEAEVRNAYDHSSDFKALLWNIGIHKEDLHGIFQHLDLDNSGEISYVEFCNALEDMTQREVRVIAALTKIDVHNMGRAIETRFDKIETKLDKLLEGRDEPQVEEMELKKIAEVKGAPQVEEMELKKIAEEVKDGAEIKKEVHAARTHWNLDSGIGTEPLDSGTVSLAQQSSMTTATVNLAQMSNMTDVFRCFQELKSDIGKQFEEQEAERSQKFKVELSSILSALKLPVVDDALRTSQFMMSSHSQSSLGILPHGLSSEVLCRGDTLQSQSPPLLVNIGQDSPATFSDSAAIVAPREGSGGNPFRIVVLM